MPTKLGDRAIYRPRVPYGRQSELFGFVVRIVDAERDVVDLVTFPAGSEVQQINGVARKSDSIRIHCWEPREVGAGGDVVSDLLAMIADLESRIAVLEAKRAGKAAETKAA